MKRMSKSLLVPKIVLVRNLFFWTFCEKNLRFFTIIFCCCPQLSKLICSCYHGVLDISWSATSYWSGISRIDKCWNWPDDCPYNLSIWSCRDMVHPVFFQVKGDQFWNLLCNTKQSVYSIWFCVACYIWHISNLKHGTQK